MKDLRHRFVVVVTAIGLIVLPILSVQRTKHLTGCDCIDPKPYLADFAVSIGCLLLLPWAWQRKQWVPALLVLAAGLLVLVNTVWPVVGLQVDWLVTAALLLWLRWSILRPPSEEAHPDDVRFFRRVVLFPVCVPLLLGTPIAFLHLGAGVYGGLQGLFAGRFFLGPLLFALSLAGLMGLLWVWSSWRRLWKGKREHTMSDVIGMTCAWFASTGFWLSTDSLHRSDEIIVIGMGLGPAILVTSAVVLFDLIVNGIARFPAPISSIWDRLKGFCIGDLAGIACGIAVMVLGILYFIPAPVSGWGPCDFGVLYPRSGPLFPAERLEVYDACDTSVMYLLFASSALALCCLLAGAAASRLGKQRAERRGLAAAAVAVAGWLVQLLWNRSIEIRMIEARLASEGRSFDYPGIDWPTNLWIAAVTIAGAALLGWIGSRFGDRRGR